MKILCFLFSMMLLQTAFAGILSVSSVETKFAYKSEFQTSSKADAEELTTQHAQFFFGYFQSPTMAEYFHVPSATLGIAAIKLPLRFHVTSDVVGKNGQRVISYKADGTLLLHKKVAKQILEGGIEVTLPYDVDNFYELKCTDEHYPSALDFWYFYDPFREGCAHLREAPMAKPTLVTLKPMNPPDETISAGFKALRGDNGNGDMFEIATINGFSESSTSSEDDGRKNFDDINNWLRDQGFQEKTLASFANRPVLEFTKTLTSREGRTINVRIVRLLAETGIGSKNVTFAKFFRRALENSDVVIYSGHSGLGGNLHIPSLEMKSGEIQFNPKKRQLFFFDSCSSYSYDLAPFENKKTKGKIDILTQGLPSYFWAEPPTHKILFKYLLDVDKDPSWLEVLKQMEKVLEGQTQMMSVGSV
ncbi:MAG: hypothetical protein JSU04_19970 [Bdellovibrionales bacterium]|nr:hypothetical protein [Bdellovibrionales bacterium]